MLLNSRLPFERFSDDIGEALSVHIVLLSLGRLRFSVQGWWVR